jgi:glucose-1-phosphate adenylyltransferase
MHCDAPWFPVLSSLAKTEVDNMKDTLAVILAGGRGERLDPLTRDRAKPAVPFGGAYRIIDFTLSNCLNSRLMRMLLLTQFKSMSLDRHIDLGWRRFFCRDLDQFIDIVPPQQRIDRGWYQGTADAVYQNIYTIEKENPRYVFILAGDHIYKMDYAKMLASHVERDADVTIGVFHVEVEAAARQFGILEIDATERVIGFEEKPEKPKPIPGDSRYCLASMGIYVFNADFLFEQLLEDANRQQSNHDFGRDIIPAVVDGYRVYAFPFHNEGGKPTYWRDVGTLDALYEANMDLVSVEPALNLYDEQWPIRTYQRVLPPPKFVFRGGTDSGRIGRALDSIVCSGCVVSGGLVEGSILGPRVRINSFSEVHDSLLFDGVKVGRHCKIRRAIIDKDIDIPENTEIGYDLERDRHRGFKITESGIVVIPKVDSLAEMLKRAN